MLDILQVSLKKENYIYERFDGSTPVAKRKTILERFEKNPGNDLPLQNFWSSFFLEVNVLLISLKAGGHGLQLVAANVVFLMDPWWNRKLLFLSFREFAKIVNKV
jgi:DNA repair protein RAD5